MGILAEFSLGFMRPQAAVRLAAHVAHCDNCRRELFDKGLAQRATEIFENRASGAAQRLIERLEQEESTSAVVLRLLSPDSEVRFEIQPEPGEQSEFKLDERPLCWLLRYECSLRVEETQTNIALAQVHLPKADWWPEASVVEGALVRIREGLRKSEHGPREMASAASGGSGLAGLGFRDRSGASWEIEGSWKEAALYVRVEYDDDK